MYPPPRTQLLIVIIVAACSIGAFVFMRSHHDPEPSSVSRGVRITPHGARDSSRSGSTPRAGVRRIMVDVVGEVRRPGVYLVDDGSRVLDALNRAGGITRHADPASLNRAAPVVDGQQLVVARRAPGVAGAVTSTPAASAAPGASGTSAPVSINTADVQTLDSLEGIGPVTAQRIVEDRTQHGPYARIEDLDRVPGIGKATIDAIRARVRL